MKLFKDVFRPKRRLARPQETLVAAFLVTILVGTLLLWLPMASSSHQSVPFNVALFTATSATCVTGLSVVDIGTIFTHFGQAIILVLIQIGGVGIMTIATFMLIVLGRRLSVRNESVLAKSIGQGQSIRLITLLRHTIVFSLIIEGCGAALLTWRHMMAGDSFWQATYFGCFHAISAFCNAGFSLFPNNLIAMRHDLIYISIIMGLIVLGGLGFLVLHNLSQFKCWMRNRMHRGRITAHSKMVLQTSLVLILLGAILHGVLEWNQAFSGLPFREKIFSALFHSISARTAGFNVIPLKDFSEPSRIIKMIMMFIGGSPGSTAGGIKTTTFMVMILTVIALVKGTPATRYGVRSIPETIVREAMAIFLLAISLVTFLFLLLLVVEQHSMHTTATLPLLFETFSAFGTVGFSLDVTPTLSIPGRLLISLAMFIGRLGPLTIVLIVSSADTHSNVHYPQEEVVVG